MSAGFRGLRGLAGGGVLDAAPVAADAAVFYLDCYDAAGVYVDSPLQIGPTVADAITLARKLIGSASTTSRATFNAPHGSAPTSPVNGDIWTTTAGIYVRINGSTVGPLSTGGGGAGAVTVLHVDLTSVGNVGGGEDDLITYNLPADTLNEDGDILSVEASYTVETSANNRFKLYFGGTVIFDSGAYTPASVDNAFLTAHITRLNSTGVGCHVTCRSIEGTIDNLFQTALIGGLTFSSAIVIKGTGQSGTTSSDDVIQHSLTVTVHDKP